MAVVRVGEHNGGPYDPASAAPPSQEHSLTDEQCEALIEASDGHWKEDVFCIGGPELMALLRAAAGIREKK